MHARGLALLLFPAPLLGEIIQTVPGPVEATNGGSGVDLITVDTDLDDWIDSFNAGGRAIYLSFDWVITDNAGETGGGGFFGGLGFYDGGAERLLLGNGWSQLSFSGGTGAQGISDTGVPYEVGTPVKIVGRLIAVNDGASNDTWEMWVNPEHGDENSPQTGSNTFTIDNFTRVTHRAGNGTGAATLSNLVIADSWDDVVPPAPSGPLEVTAFEYQAEASPDPTVTLTWRKSGVASYVINASTDLVDWTNQVGTNVTDANDENPEDAEQITVTFGLPEELDMEAALFFRVEEVPAG